MAQALMLALMLAGSSAFTTLPSPLSHRQAAALSASRAPTFPVMAVAAPKKPLSKKPVVKKKPVAKKPPAPRKVVKKVVKRVVKKVIAKRPAPKKVVKKVVKRPAPKKVVKKVVAKSAVRDPRFAYEAKLKAKRVASQKAAKLRELQKNKIAQARKERSKAYCDSEFSGKIGRKGAFNFRTMLLGFSVNKANEIEKRTTRSNKYF